MNYKNKMNFVFLRFVEILTGYSFVGKSLAENFSSRQIWNRKAWGNSFSRMAYPSKPYADKVFFVWAYRFHGLGTSFLADLKAVSLWCRKQETGMSEWRSAYRESGIKKTYSAFLFCGERRYRLVEHTATQSAGYSICY